MNFARALVALFFCVVAAERAPRERPDVATPRTGWSIRGKSEIKWFHACHASLAEGARAYEPAPPGGVRLALIGDSQTESWLGTSYCKPTPRARKVPAVLARTLAARWPRPVVLGLSADMTQQLLWRLQHGELTRAMEADPGLVSVVTIGTNNLGKGHTALEAIAGVEAVARLLLNRTRGRLLLNAVLPRGDGATARAVAAAVRIGEKPNGRPLLSFQPSVDAVNRAVRASVHGGALGRGFPGRVSFVDCGAPFRAAPGAPPQKRPGAEGAPAEVDARLMPDRLHPSAEGHALWAACLAAAIAELKPAAGAAR